VLDVTKAEADKLKWDAPHGAKVGVAASGSPAEQVGLKSGDFVLSIDGREAETSSEVERATGAKSPGAEIRLSVLSGGPNLETGVHLPTSCPEHALFRVVALNLMPAVP
jgi:S1-C subfamily serine protease